MSAFSAERLRAAATPRNGVLLAFAAAWGVLRWCFTDIADDAFITWRYALNFVEGRGFAFNPGEPVYGTTAPLFGFLNAGGMALGVQPWTWTLALDVVWGAGILWKLRELIERAGHGAFFPAAAVVVLLASMETLATPGMETGLYCFLLLGTIAAVSDPMAHPWKAAAWGSAAAMLRPDGIVVLLVAGAFAAVRAGKTGAWRPFLAACAIPVVAGAAYAALLLALFGTIVPQTVVAKSVRLATWPDISTFGDLLVEYLLRWRQHPGSPLPLWPNWAALGGAAALGWTAWKRPAARPLAAFVVAYAAFFALGRAPRFDWYLVPLALVLRAWSGIFAGLCVVAAARWAGGRWEPMLRARLGFAAAVAAIAIQFPQATLMAHHIGWNAGAFGPQTDLKLYGEAVCWIVEQDGREIVIASNEIGQIGFFSGARIFDTEGLVTPEALDGMRRGLDPIQIAREAGAPWFVAYFPRDAGPIPELFWFQRLVEEGYRPVRAFEAPRWPVTTFAFRLEAQE